MISVMPVIAQATPMMSTSPAGADGGAANFDETLRLENAALSRTAQRAVDQEGHAPRDEQGPVVRVAARELPEGESELPEKTARPAQLAPALDAAGKNELVAVATQGKDETGGLIDDDLLTPASAEQLQPLPAWLLVAQPMIPVVAVDAAAAPDFAQPGYAQGHEKVGENADLAARQAAATPGAAADSQWPGRSLAAEDMAARAGAVTVAAAVRQTRQPSLPATGQAPLLPTAGAAMVAPVQTLAEIGVSAEVSGATVNQAAARPVGDLRGSLTPIVPEITPSVTVAGSVELTQVIGQEVLSPAGRAAAAQTETAGLALVNQITDPLSLGQAPAPAVISTTIRAERPVMIPGDNAPLVDSLRPGDPGLPATMVAAPAPGDAASEHQQFADFARAAALEVEEAPRPADSGRPEFWNLLTGSDQAVLSGSVRSSGSAPVIPAAVSSLALDGRIVEQVVSRVKLSGANGETSLALTLHPKELGEIRVELVAGREGMRAHLHSQTQMVQEILERHLPRLREAFEAQGVKLSELQVSCDGRREGGNAASQQREQGQWPQSRYPLADSRAGAGAQLEWAAGLGASNSGWSSVPGFSLRV